MPPSSQAARVAAYSPAGAQLEADMSSLRFRELSRAGELLPRRRSLSPVPARLFAGGDSGVSFRKLSLQYAPRATMARMDRTRLSLPTIVERTATIRTTRSRSFRAKTHEQAGAIPQLTEAGKRRAVLRTSLRGEHLPALELRGPVEDFLRSERIISAPRALPDDEQFISHDLAAHDMTPRARIAGEMPMCGTAAGA